MSDNVRAAIAAREAAKAPPPPEPPPPPPRRPRRREAGTITETTTDWGYEPPAESVTFGPDEGLHE